MTTFQSCSTETPCHGLADMAGVVAADAWDTSALASAIGSALSALESYEPVDEGLIARALAPVPGEPPPPLRVHEGVAQLAGVLNTLLYDVALDAGRLGFALGQRADAVALGWDGWRETALEAIRADGCTPEEHHAIDLDELRGIARRIEADGAERGPATAASEREN